MVHPLNQCKIWDGCNAEMAGLSMAAPAAPDEGVPMIVPIGRGPYNGRLDLGPAFEATALEGQRAQDRPPGFDQVEVGGILGGFAIE